MERTAIRRLLLLAFGALLAATSAIAQPYPSQPIRFVNGFAAGGATDVAFRTLAEDLRIILGQSVINENKAGANGRIAQEEVARAKPDGYTFLVHNSSAASAAILTKDKSGFDPEKMFVVVSPATGGPWGVLAAVKELPAATFQEFVAYAKANPNKLRYASSGALTGPHFDMVLLMKRAGIELVHLPQRGAGGTLTALNNRDAHVGTATMATLTAQVQSGDLKVLAALGPQRVQSLPEVPTLPELGFPTGNPLWHALYAPLGTPQPILDTMFNAIQKALKSERMQELYKRSEMWPIELKSHAEAQEWSRTSLDNFRKVIAEVGENPK